MFRRGTLRLASLLGVGCLAVACAAESTATDDEDIVRGRVDPTTLSMSDVSILMPVPAPGTDPLLKPSSKGARGPLLPAALLPKIGRVVAVASNDDLRVVSARVDPCFPDLSLLDTKPESCRRQIRLVLQPYSSSGAFSDAAVHLLYDLDKQDFPKLVTELAGLGDRSETQRKAPLAVHPKLASEGAGGATARRMNEVILRYAGEKTLVRIALMTLDEPDTEWNFKAFNVVSGALVADPIPLLGALRDQQITKGLPQPGTTAFDMEIHPASERGQKLVPLLRETAVPKIKASAFDGALEAAFFTEHPAKSNPMTIDCATCHLGPNARLFAERTRSAHTSGDARRYTSARDLTLTSSLATQKLPSMRAFGYFGKEPAISPRTVNETAAVLDALVKHGL